MRTVNDVMDELYDILEEQTFRNIVLCIRKEELIQIIKGDSAVDVIPQSNQRSKLLRDGVLEAYYGAGGKRIIVSNRAKHLLRNDYE